MHFTGDMSLSEAVSNISSPDYQDQDDMFEAGRDCPRMELSDPSDSDSTILASEPSHKRAKPDALNGDNDYRIVIQVKGPDKPIAHQTQPPIVVTKENGIKSPENRGYQVNVYFAAC